jgi:carboxymethylenebutenolidase
VDELLLTFTHTTRMDWILPRVPPTSKRVEVDLVAIVYFRGDKICGERIYWDHARVLQQVGLLQPAQ